MTGHRPAGPGAQLPSPPANARLFARRHHDGVDAAAIGDDTDLMGGVAMRDHKLGVDAQASGLTQRLISQALRDLVDSGRRARDDQRANIPGRSHGHYMNDEQSRPLAPRQPGGVRQSAQSRRRIIRGRQDYLRSVTGRFKDVGSHSHDDGRPHRPSGRLARLGRLAGSAISTAIAVCCWDTRGGGVGFNNRPRQEQIAEINGTPGAVRHLL